MKFVIGIGMLLLYIYICYFCTYRKNHNDYCYIMRVSPRFTMKCTYDIFCRILPLSDYADRTHAVGVVIAAFSFSCISFFVMVNNGIHIPMPISKVMFPAST